MKTSIRLTAILAAAIMLVCSCQNREKLAKNLQGVWRSTTPEYVNDSTNVNVSMLKTYVFKFDADNSVKSSGPDGGTVTVTALIDVTKAVAASDSIVAPLTVTAAASATMTGTYEATTYDKFQLILHNSSFTLDVDPSTVNYEFDALTDVAQPEIGDISPVLASQIKEELTPLIREKFLEQQIFEDVRIKGSLMTCKSNGTELTFSLQCPIEEMTDSI